MNDIERMVIEEISNMFKNKESNLGIIQKRPKETSHGLQFQWEGLNDAFSLKVADSVFHESLTAAFKDIHGYRYINDPQFTLSFETRLKSCGIPIIEREKAMKAIEEVRKEWATGSEMDELHAGWHPQIDEITDMTRNATTRKAENTNPHAGGGSAPDKNEMKNGK
jgi:hypothetical protein